jgi:ribosomal protein L29
MNMEEIRKSSAEELLSKEKELKKELVKLQAQVAMGTQIKSPGQIGEIKKNIARIETEMKNKQRKA